MSFTINKTMTEKINNDFLNKEIEKQDKKNKEIKSIYNNLLDKLN